MNTITGNILEVIARSGGILVHQVNCQKVAGSGMALQIRRWCPAWFEVYKNFQPVLGSANLSEVARTPSGSKIYIGDLYGQDGYGVTKCHTNYGALERALNHLRNKITEHGHYPINRYGPIYFPFKMGCGLAGGDWEVVSILLCDKFPTGTIVKLPWRQQASTVLSAI